MWLSLRCFLSFLAYSSSVPLRRRWPQSLVRSQGGKVVHAGKAHDLPPGVLFFSLPGFGPLHLFDALLEEPAREPPAGMLLGNGGFGHYVRAPVGGVRLAWVGRYPFMVNPGSIGYRRSRGQDRFRPSGLLGLQTRPSASATSSATSEGFVAALMPASLSASLLASAVLSPPETMAPACPMVLPSGAVKPAI
jgi:hypothetical protein